jgi:hypothetical protein
MDSKNLTVLPDHWYAAELFGASGASTNPTLSPILVSKVEALKTGQGLMRLSFYHANYPEGVRDKVYDLRVVARSHDYLAAVRTERGSNCLMIVIPITRDWLRINFPTLAVTATDDLHGFLTKAQQDGRL